MKRTAWSMAAVCALVCVTAATGASAQQDGERIEQRLQRLEDIESIRRLMSDYVRLLDAQDFAGFSQLFARDGSWAGGGGTVVGPDAIRAAMLSAFGPDSDAVWTSDFHLTGNAIIEVDGDTAVAESRWVFISPSRLDAPTMMLAGRYEDSFIREDGAWRFRSRQLVQDMAHDNFPAVRQAIEDDSETGRN